MQTARTVLALAALGASIASAAVDPFYSSRLQAGSRAYERGDHATAARQLRIACFGLLDEPTRLADGLLRLGLAQAASGDADGFRTSFLRLLELEERWGSYTAASTPVALRATFEALLIERLPAAELQASPTFAAVLERAADQRTQVMTPEDRRRELHRLAESETVDPAPLLELAQIEFRSGKPGDALRWVDRALRLDPANDAARCLGVEIAASRKSCKRVAEDIASCSGPPANPAVARSVLACLEKRGPDSLAGYLALLPSDPRESAEALWTTATTQAPVAVAETETPSEPEPGAPVEPPQSPVPRVLDAESQRQLEAARGALGRATSLQDLREAFSLAAGVANGHPGHPGAQFLAAQIAYRASDWPRAVTYFRRGGPLPEDQPVLGFYFAVALVETGDVSTARTVLEPVLSRIDHTPFVDAYAKRILEDE